MIISIINNYKKTDTARATNDILIDWLIPSPSTSEYFTTTELLQYAFWTSGVASAIVLAIFMHNPVMGIAATTCGKVTWGTVGATVAAGYCYNGFIYCTKLLWPAAPKISIATTTSDTISTVINKSAMIDPTNLTDMAMAGAGLAGATVATIKTLASTVVVNDLLNGGGATGAVFGFLLGASVPVWLPYAMVGASTLYFGHKYYESSYSAKTPTTAPAAKPETAPKSNLGTDNQCDSPLEQFEFAGLVEYINQLCSLPNIAFCTLLCLIAYIVVQNNGHKNANANLCTLFIMAADPYAVTDQTVTLGVTIGAAIVAALSVMSCVEPITAYVLIGGVFGVNHL